MLSRITSLVVGGVLVLALGVITAVAATKTVTIKVQGMKCAKCSGAVTKALKATDGLDDSTQLFDLDNAESVNALIAGKIDVAAFPSQIDDTLLQRALGGPGLRLMDIAQAQAIAKIIPELKHVVLWRGLISLGRDIPSSDINLIALRNRLLVRKDLHPALQYLLLEAMREVHWAPGLRAAFGAENGKAYMR